MSGELAERLAGIRARLEAACASAGRDPSSVTLVAVSKTKPLALVQEAFAAGQVHFGENYAQELRDKADAMGPGPVWHFIGNLQRNKVKYVAGRADLFHALDSVRLAREFQKRAPGQAVLVQVNTSGEGSKSGVPPAEALALCEQVHALEGIELRGLMTMPAPSADPAGAAPAFRVLRELAEEGRRRGLPLSELSMGMTRDFEVAIAEGATLVRVGTAIFGARGG